MIKFLILMLATFNLYASSMCIDCMSHYPNWMAPQIAPNPYMPFYSQQASPWWYPYGQYQYRNWQAPGLWQPFPPAMPGHHYPGDGNMAAAKPNVYLSGKGATKFSIKLHFAKASLWIAAPSLKGKLSAWQGELIKDREIAVDGAYYPYLYYDYRSHLELFQQEEGFCGGKNKVIAEMIQILENAGFKKSEVDDFKEHWPHKLPNASHYCVYPQENAALQKAVRFEITPKAHLVQLNFIVYLDHEQAPAPRPGKPWRASVYSKDDPNVFEVREWGVSFIVDNKKIP